LTYFDTTIASRFVNTAATPKIGVSTITGL
jgi:hypothetical protein